MKVRVYHGGYECFLTTTGPIDIKDAYAQIRGIQGIRFEFMVVDDAT